MSLFKSQMFTEDASSAAPDFDRDADAFGPSYGNRLASERRFRDFRPAPSPSPVVEAVASECEADA